MLHAIIMAGGTGTRVRDAFHLVVDTAARVCGKRSAIREVAWPDDADQIEFRQFTANIDRMADTYAWRPSVPLSDGVERLVDHFEGRH